MLFLLLILRTIITSTGSSHEDECTIAIQNDDEGLDEDGGPSNDNMDYTRPATSPNPQYVIYIYIYIYIYQTATYITWLKPVSCAE